MGSEPKHCLKWLDQEKEPFRSLNGREGYIAYHIKIEEELIKHYENNKPNTIEDCENFARLMLLY